MRKYMFLLAALALFSCAKEQNIPEEEQPIQEEVVPQEPETTLKHLTFTGITDDGLTKTTLGTGYSIVWSTEDDITVFSGADADGSIFTVTKLENDNKKAIFSGLGLPAVDHYAVSPAQGASISGGVITAVLPMTQGVLNGSFGAQANLSVAKSDAESDEFFFRNATGILALKVANSGITGIRLESLGDEKLSGEATIRFSGDLPVVTPTDNAHSWVTLSGEASADDTYYFAVFPGYYSQGFRITMYKDGKYGSVTSTTPLKLERNGNVFLGTLPAITKWKTPGTVVLRGEAAEDGQEMSFAANQYADMNISRNRGTQIEAFAGDEYTYEAFTSLKAGKTLYFQDGDQRYAVFSGMVMPIASAAEAPAAPVDHDGVYRVRLNLPYGKAYFQEVTAVEFDRCTLQTQALTYEGNGEWHTTGMVIGSGDNRYKFHFTIDGETQVYGRMYNTDKQPGQTGLNPAPDSYYYLQPAIMDTWEPGFKYPYGASGNGNWYADILLKMHGAHYTHTFYVVDSSNLPSISAGENVYIQGPGAMDAGQRLAFIDASWRNIIDADYGDPDKLAGPDGYNYEIFTKLEKDKKFYFQTDKGYKFAFSADGNSVVKIASPSAVPYEGVKVTGVYRLRMNFETGALSAIRVDIVRLKQPSLGDFDMTYAGKGTWEINEFGIKWLNQTWNTHEDRYKFIMWLSYKPDGTTYVNAWQHLGQLEDNYIQPLKPDDEWKGSFHYPDYLCGDTAGEAAKKATVTLSLNADSAKYTHSFTNEEDVDASPVYVSLDVTSTEETFTMHKSADGSVFEGVSTFTDGATVNMVATDNCGRRHELSTTATVDGVAYLEANPSTGSYTFTALPTLLAEGNAVNGFSTSSGVSLSYDGNGVYKVENAVFAGSAEGNPDTMTPTYPYSKWGRARFTFIKPNTKNSPEFRRLDGSRKAIECESHGSTSEIQINPGTYNIKVDLRSFTFDIQPVHSGDKRITVMGSSVPTGTGATGEKGYMYLFGTNALTDGWTLSNRSVPGNNTITLTQRYDDLIMDGGKYVIFALSLGNENIHGAADQDAIYKQWKTNMQSLISRARNEGRKVVVMGNYGRGDFNSSDYAKVKAINMEIHQWNVPSMNVLGAVDDEAGHWPSGYQNGDDTYHPNDAGHAEMSYTLVPSVFDAMEAGKPLPVRDGSGSIDLSSGSVSFKPEATIHPFTVAFYVKTTSAGNILHIGGPSLSRYYSASALGVNDGNWHLVVLTHYYAQGLTRVYVDGAHVGGLYASERIEANSFSITGGTFRELFFWRSGMNADEISALYGGAMLNSSLEIYAPFKGGSADNLAMSENQLNL